MASIYKRKNQDGTSCWRAIVRIKGYPSICNHFERKQEAHDWAADTERQIRMGQFKFDRAQHTFSELVEHYINSGALEHHKAARDTMRHLQYWQTRLNAYALVHLTPEFIAKERKYLQETPNSKGRLRSSATVNRHIASLSAILTYAWREVRWITENPCFNLTKLKEPAGRDRALSVEEAARLLDACRESRSPYLYCIVLLAITTGMRQGEILGLQWSQIDFQNCLAHLKDTKNGRPRSVPLVVPVVEELKRLHEQRHPAKPLVFASRTAFGRTEIKKAWQAALERAQIKNLKFHDTRHSFATMAARQGASNLELAAAMGHRTLQMLQRYPHLEGQATRHLSIHISDQVVRILNDRKS